jgi:hypothetical protein
MNCLYCDKELTGKKRYCSEAHSKAYRRRTQAGHEPGQNDPEFNPDTRDLSDLGLTRTDKLFEDYKPNYYNFDEKVFDSKCILPDCGAKFKTHLKLLRFCSPTHQTTGLDRIIRDGKV